MMPDWEERGVHDHPGIETLSAYVDGTLGDRERAAVEAHVADCEECLELVTEVMHVQPEEAEAGAKPPGGGVVTPPGETAGRVRPFTRRPWVWAAAAAVVLVTIRFGPFLPGRDGTQPVQRLVATVGEQRLVEARLGGGFRYGALQSPLRSQSVVASDSALLAAVADLQRRAQESGSPRDLHAYGVGLVLVGNVDLAIDALQGAAQARPADPLVRSDLGAAFMTRAQGGGREDDWDRALAEIDEALQRDPNQSEALFNRALTLTRLGRVDPAREAWERYLAHDAASPWSNEARRHLSTMRSGGRRPN
jgi:anti-sigma factor RsiW